MKTMFDIIKKQNGEHFAKAIRAYDNGIFDIPDLDKIVKFAGREVEPLMNYLVSLKNVKIEEHAVHQHPFDLLSKAGYTAYYADTLEKQNWPKQFYAKGEELCTFHDPNRYKNYHIVVAIKKNVQDIKRENFPHPKREDEYGTSVLQIQMLKSGGFISIKNRYNHTVENPDNTFNSNPDNIISGLSDALKHHYHVDFSSQKVHLPENFVLIDNQIVNCNYEINNVYFSENCYVEDGNIHEIDKQKELMLDYFILNLQDKSIKNPSELENGFIAALQEEIKDKKLQITVNEQGNKCLQADGKTILELDHGKIKSLHFDNVKKIDDNFLQYNNELSDVSLSNVISIGSRFLHDARFLEGISLPKVKNIDHQFLSWGKNLKRVSLPQVEKIGDNFLFSNNQITEISLPNVLQVGNEFLPWNALLSEVSLPKIEIIQDSFLASNNILTHVSLPKVKKIGSDFLRRNSVLEEISLPNVQQIGAYFLHNNEKLSHISLPQVDSIDKGFLFENKIISQISFPKVTKIGDDFLCCNNIIAQISLPEVTSIGENFLYENEKLQHISLPKIQEMGDNFLRYNQQLKEISLPKIQEMGDNFLQYHPKKKKLLKNISKSLTKRDETINIIQQLKSNLYE